MKKLLSGLLVLSFVFGTVCGVKALENTPIETRASTYELTRTANVKVPNITGANLGTMSTSCTVQIKNTNGVKVIESYTCKADRKTISSDVYATATLASITKSGMKLTAKWRVTTYFPANMVTSTKEVTYDFN